MLTIPPATARHLLLHAQGMLAQPSAPASREDVLTTIRRMGVLQIDTINVVARSPYLTLFSRLGDYDPAWLDELLAEKSLFEWWAHAACFIPIEDYPFFRRLMVEKPRFWHSPHEWKQAHPESVQHVIDTIRENGETRSADFENRDGRTGGWWNWKIEKTTLEVLLDSGELMVARRRSFQRVYDLTARVHPGWDAVAAPALDEVYRRLLVKTVRCLGVARADWAADYYRLPKRECPPLLRELAEKGELLEMRVEGWKLPAYMHPDNLPLLDSDLTPTRTAFLSPFDPLVWHRERARELFGFDYTIECYTPAAKRVYGYFTLPILWKDRLVGRMDAKAHRARGEFEVRGMFFEPGVDPDEVREDLDAALQNLAAWHGTPTVVYGENAAGVAEN